MKILKSWFERAFAHGFLFGVFLGILSYILKIAMPQTSMFSDYILVFTYFMCYPVYAIMHRIMGGLGRPRGLSIVYSVSFIMWITTYEIIVRYLVG